MHVLRLTAAELGNERESRVLPQTEFHVPFLQSMGVLVTSFPRLRRNVITL
jgi:hypothetical protein